MDWFLVHSPYVFQIYFLTLLYHFLYPLQLNSAVSTLQSSTHAFDMYPAIHYSFHRLCKQTQNTGSSDGSAERCLPASFSTHRSVCHSEPDRSRRHSPVTGTYTAHTRSCQLCPHQTLCHVLARSKQLLKMCRQLSGILPLN